MQGFFVKDKTFYRTFFRLALALMLEQAVVLCVNLADNVMIGSYSEVSLSGVAAVNQIQFFIQQIAFGFSSALIVLAGQYWGANQLHPIRKIAALGIRLELVFAFMMFVVVSVLPQQIVGLFLQDEAMIAEGTAYLRIIRFSYPFFALTTILLGTMRTVENVRLALRVSVVSLIVNCSINFLLISGRFGAPELGVRGAAIGTLTARILECGIVSWYVFGFDKKLQMQLSDLWGLDKALTADYAKIAAPIVLQSAMWGASNCIQTAILGHIDGNAVAAYSISSTLFLLLKVTAVGAATAASILVAKQVGKGDISGVRQTARTLQVIFLCMGVVLGLALFAVRMPLLSLYNLLPQTRQLAKDFLLLQCFVICTMSYQMPTNMGILRGGGDTKFPVILDFISIWLIVLPLSYLAAFYWHAAPLTVAICLNLDQGFKCIPNAIRCNRYRWIRKLTREET